MADGWIIGLIMAFTGGAGTLPEDYVPLSVVYEVACEGLGGKWVNDNPSFYQSYSCVGATRPQS